MLMKPPPLEDPIVAIGMDPDLAVATIAAVSLINGQWKLLGVAAVKTKGRPTFKSDKPLLALDGIRQAVWDFRCVCPQACVVAVESQQDYGAGKTESPADLIRLGQAAGMALALASEYWDEANLMLPMPQAWKGSVSKAVHQARVFVKMNIPFETRGGMAPYAVPLDRMGLTMGDWKHAADSVGLAVWAAEQTAWERVKQRALAR